jgi:hypothetical protein
MERSPGLIPAAGRSPPAGFALPHAIDRPLQNINFALESS